MASWTHDVRPMSLVQWGSVDNEIRKQTLIKDNSGGINNEIRPSCIIATGTDIGEE